MRHLKRVQYERCLICHVDLLGFRDLVRERSPGEISKFLRVFSDEVSPKTPQMRVPELLKTQFVAFSDLHITVIPTEQNGRTRGLIFMQLLRLLHAQSILFFNHGILVRGGVVVGDAVRSYGRFFGQGIIDAYDVESRKAIYPRIIVDRSVFEELSRNPQIWTHDKNDEIQAVKSLLHRDDENGVFYIDYLRVMRGELDFPELYGQYLQDFRTKVEEMLAKATDQGARSKLEWMKRYYQRIFNLQRRSATTG